MLKFGGVLGVCKGGVAETLCRSTHHGCTPRGATGNLEPK